MDFHASSTDLSLKDSGFVDPDSNCNHCNPASNLEMLSDSSVDSFSAGDAGSSISADKTQHGLEPRGGSVDPRTDGCGGVSTTSERFSRNEISTNMSNQKTFGGFLRGPDEPVTRTLSLHRKDFVTDVSCTRVSDSHRPAAGGRAAGSRIGSASSYVVEASVSETSEMIFGTIVRANVKADVKGYGVDFCGAAKKPDISTHDKVDSNTSRVCSPGRNDDSSEILQIKGTSSLCNGQRLDSRSQEDLTMPKDHSSLRSAYSVTLQSQTDCCLYHPRRTSISDVVVTSSFGSSSVQSHHHRHRSLTVRHKSSAAGGVSAPGDAGQNIRSVENLDRFLSRTMNHDDSIISSHTVVVKQESNDLFLHRRTYPASARMSESFRVAYPADNRNEVSGKPEVSAMSPSVAAQKPSLSAEDDPLMASEKLILPGDK